MSHILVLLDPACADLESGILNELTARYGGEFEIIDPTPLLEGEPDESITPLGVCYFWILAAKQRHTADVYIALTRRMLLESAEMGDFVFVWLSPQKMLAFTLLQGGGGVMQWIERPEETYPLPEQDTLTVVFETIEANDKERFS